MIDHRPDHGVPMPRDDGPVGDLESDYHVWPMEDLREHVQSTRCWCRPTQDAQDLRVWVHRSMDGRELYESGKRRMS